MRHANDLNHLGFLRDTWLRCPLDAAQDVLYGTEYNDPDPVRHLHRPPQHEKISRRHARLRATVGEVVIEDLGSTNCVLVGGVRLEGNASARLALGDSFQFGPYSVLLVRSSTSEPSIDGVARAAVTVLDPTPSGAPRSWGGWPAAPSTSSSPGRPAPARRSWRARCTSSRAAPGRFVGINCATLSEPLLESELFG